MTSATIVGVFAGGAAFAGALWLIAAHVARRRTIALGSLPAWLPIVAGAAAVGPGICFPFGVALAASISLIGAIVCALVDARTGFIFDALSITIVGAAAGAVLVDGRLVDGALGVAVVGGALAALYLLTGRSGIGLGDVKLGSAVALGYGPESALVAIGSAFILGALYAGVLMGLGRAKRTDAIRFGPFIAGGAVVGLTASALGWPG
jgi:leader peptidase (prepilin peptidase)/N-methyltransferase